MTILAYIKNYNPKLLVIIIIIIIIIIIDISEEYLVELRDTDSRE